MYICYHLQGQVCKLKRSLYGLKQTSREWNKELTAKLYSIWFVQSNFDHYLFTKSTATGFVILLVYVDDILVTSNSISLIDSVKSFLHYAFTIKDLRPTHYFLGLQIARGFMGTYVRQRKYVLDLISERGLSDAKTADTPMVKSEKVLSIKGT